MIGRLRRDGGLLRLGRQAGSLQLAGCVGQGYMLGGLLSLHIKRRQLHPVFQSPRLLVQVGLRYEVDNLYSRLNTVPK